MSEKLEFLNKYTFHRDYTVQIIDNVDYVKDADIPKLWKEIINEPTPKRISRVIELWENIVGEQMRNTISYFKEHLVDVEVMKLGDSYYILYSISNRELEYYTGGNPNESEKKFQNISSDFFEKLPLSLKDFYGKLHDGFYYFASRSMGLDPVNQIESLDGYEWGILEESDVEVKINLKTSYNFFSNGGGSYIVFDMEDTFENKAVLWSSKFPPEYNLDFWKKADEWLAMNFDN